MEPKQYLMLGILLSVATIGSIILIRILMKLDPDVEDTKHGNPHGGTGEIEHEEEHH